MFSLGLSSNPKKQFAKTVRKILGLNVVFGMFLATLSFKKIMGDIRSWIFAAQCFTLQSGGKKNWNTINLMAILISLNVQIL